MAVQGGGGAIVLDDGGEMGGWLEVDGGGGCRILVYATWRWSGLSGCHDLEKS